MTLAGNLKLRNFVLIAIVAVGAGSVGLYMACSGKKHTEEEKEERKRARSRFHRISLISFYRPYVQLRWERRVNGLTLSAVLR